MILPEDIQRQHDPASFARKVVFPPQRGADATPKAKPLIYMKVLRRTEVRRANRRAF
jgi:hypothetical protein